MNLSNQIKKYRNAHGFSQEELAKRIYVSRQTISNWETERSYPDIQTLLLLSVLFDVSLDELVKGDLEMMKQTVDSSKMNTLSWVMGACLVLSTLGSIPAWMHFGTLGLLIPGAIYAVGLSAAAYIEVLKKRNNVKTYSEILAFMNNEELDEAKASQEHSHYLSSKLIMALVFAAIAAALTLLGGFAYSLFS